MAAYRPIGPLLRAARIRVGKTQAELAREAGIAPNHLVRLESGEKAVPRFDTVAKVAAALGLSLDELAAGAGYRDRLKMSSGDAQRLKRAAQSLRGVRDHLEADATHLSELITSLDGMSGSSGKRR